MGIWTQTKRSLGFGDARFWRQPPMFRFRLAGDYLPRLAFGAGIGLAVNGPLLGIMLASAPSGEVWRALLLGLATVLLFGFIAFTWLDMVVVTIALEDAGIRRKTKPLFVNRFGFRNREDFWAYPGIAACGVVPPSATRATYSILVVGSQLHLTALGIPSGVDLQKVVALLTSRGLKVQTLKRLPPQARPATSVSRRGFVLAGILGGLGVLLVCIGGFARLAIHRGGGSVDLAAVKRSLEAANLGKVIRQWTVAGDQGVSKARISPDGRWVWGLTEKAKKHLLWNDGQDAAVGEIAVAPADASDAAFTPDSRRVVVCAGGEAHVWQLQPLESLKQFSLLEQPDAFVISQDGKSLVAITIIGLRVYDLESGKPTAGYKIAPNAITCAAMSADGRSVVVVGQQRIFAVSLQDGAATEIVSFPGVAYLFGSIANGGAWAAMQGPKGTDVFDLAAKQKRTTIATGLPVFAPPISPEGTRLAGASTDSVGVWDVATGKPVAKFPTSSLMQLALSANAKRLIGYAPGSAKVTLWEMPP